MVFSSSVWDTVMETAPKWGFGSGQPHAWIRHIFGLRSFWHGLIGLEPLAAILVRNYELDG